MNEGGGWVDHHPALGPRSRKPDQKLRGCGGRARARVGRKGIVKYRF